MPEANIKILVDSEEGTGIIRSIPIDRYGQELCVHCGGYLLGEHKPDCTRFDGIREIVRQMAMKRDEAILAALLVNGRRPNS